MGKRGKSQAVKDAMAHLAANPTATAEFLAVKFGLNITTIYRADWWKNRAKEPK